MQICTPAQIKHFTDFVCLPVLPMEPEHPPEEAGL